MSNVVFFWFRRDLRLNDNTGLSLALTSGRPVVPLFIFDTNIIHPLKDKRDRRVSFIFSRLRELDNSLRPFGGGLCVKHGAPVDVWRELFSEFGPGDIYTNRDYEPYAIRRDREVGDFCLGHGVSMVMTKDQVVFDTNEILKADGTPYTVFTPYKKKWLDSLKPSDLELHDTASLLNNIYPCCQTGLPAFKDIGFEFVDFNVPTLHPDPGIITHYHETRDIPSLEGTLRMSVHLRFGTVSIRELVKQALDLNETWLSELIWREFFMMILYHFPHVEDRAFKPAYDRIEWRYDQDLFQAWCDGRTGYPLVDAGMRELNTTGYMHNRVRMVTASFLCKHLLIDWRWGERYFAEKLLDFDLSANNGNWQWAAGSGCDAAPYFRVFNPELQQKKFDPDFTYIKKWAPEFGSPEYPPPIIEHTFARNRAIEVYKKALKG